MNHSCLNMHKLCNNISDFLRNVAQEFLELVVFLQNWIYSNHMFAFSEKCREIKIEREDGKQFWESSSGKRDILKNK